MVKGHSDSEKGNPAPSHGLFPYSSNTEFGLVESLSNKGE